MKTKRPKIILNILASFLFSIIGLASLYTPTAHAIDSVDICSQSGVSAEVKRANGCSGDATNDLSNAITSIVNAVIGVIGLVATIFILVGAINYMTSAGDAGKIEKAKKTILWAAIGLVIAALTFAIVNFVIAGILNQ